MNLLPSRQQRPRAPRSRGLATSRLLLPALAATLLAVSAPAASNGATPDACSFQDMRGCQTCAELSVAIEGISPDEGRYEDGIRWTPLFGAFLKNCQRLALHLVEDEHARPALGGRHGSMLITVSTHWENRNPRTSAQWARMLKRLGADADTVLPDTGKSSRQLVDQGIASIDYPEIWKLFATD